MKPFAVARAAALVAILAAAPSARADAPDGSQAPFARVGAAQPAAIELSRTTGRMPDGSRVEMLGLSYYVAVNDAWGVGVSGYGADGGHFGGLINWGVSVQRRWRLGPHSHVAAGLYAGAGGGRGGGAVNYGGGLMLRPELSIRTELDSGVYTGIGVAELLYPSGNVRGRPSLTLVIGRSTNFAAFAPTDEGRTGHTGGRTGIGVDEVMLFAGVYAPRASSRDLSGQPLGHKPVLGADLRQYIAEGSWWGVDAAAAGGGAAGYMDVIAKLGQDWPLFTPRLRLGGELGAGVGGGGGVNTGDGLLLRAGPTLRWIGPGGVSLHLGAGFMKAPSGQFSTAYARAGLSVPLDHVFDYTGQANSDEGEVRRQQIFAGFEHLPTMRRKDGTKIEASDLMIVVTRDLTDSVYGVAQAGSGAFGGAGGYSIALLGLGLQSPRLGAFGLPRLRVGAELLGGAAGGGSVDVGRGAVGQGEAWAQWSLGERLQLRTGLGQWRVLRGENKTTSTMFSVMLGYAYGTLEQ
ncbi:MAG: hypothetical protein JO224_09845 [Pelomonas sp.]|nr:hypothetical protein [Roseateles sp.]